MVKVECPVTDEECPLKAKVVDEILKRWAAAELEAEAEGINPEWVFWRNKKPAKTSKKRRKRKKL